MLTHLLWEDLWEKISGSEQNIKKFSGVSSTAGTHQKDISKWLKPIADGK